MTTNFQEIYKQIKTKFENGDTYDCWCIEINKLFQKYNPKLCNNCGNMKPTKDFYKHRNICKDCFKNKFGSKSTSKKSTKPPTPKQKPNLPRAENGDFIITDDDEVKEKPKKSKPKKPLLEISSDEDDDEKKCDGCKEFFPEEDLKHNIKTEQYLCEECMFKDLDVESNEEESNNESVEESNNSVEENYDEEKDVRSPLQKSLDDCNLNLRKMEKWLKKNFPYKQNGSKLVKKLLHERIVYDLCFVDYEDWKEFLEGLTYQINLAKDKNVFLLKTTLEETYL